MLEQNEKQQELANICSFVTIKIFARTEQLRCRMDVHNSFVTIKIFARTEHDVLLSALLNSFVTIKIFARTEQLRCRMDVHNSFVTIKIFARTERWKRNGY